METGTIKRWFFGLVAVSIMVSLAYHIGHRKGIMSSCGGYEVRTDTLFFQDTITKEKPVPVLVEVHDSIPYPVVEIVRDTIWLPREVKVYEDEFYRAAISGYQPSLDWIEVYPEESVVTQYLIPEKKIRKSRWGVGVTAGYGIHLGEKVQTAPYIGVGISYNLLTW